MKYVYLFIVIMIIFVFALATGYANCIGFNCVNFEDPDTYDCNNDGIDDVQNLGGNNYKVIGEITMCPGQYFNKLIIDDNAAIDCFITYGKSLMSLDNEESARIVMYDNSKLERCGFQSLDINNESYLFINGDNVYVGNVLLLGYRIVINGSNNTIINNRLTRYNNANKVGIDIIGGDNNLVFKNHIKSDSEAISIDGNSSERSIGNTFIISNEIELKEDAYIHSDERYAISIQDVKDCNLYIDYNRLESYSGIFYKNDNIFSQNNITIRYNVIKVITNGVNADATNFDNIKLKGNSFIKPVYNTINEPDLYNDVYLLDGSYEIEDNAFCSSGNMSLVSTSMFSFNDNFCGYKSINGMIESCSYSCDDFDRRIEMLTDPFEYKDKKLELVFNEPEEYDSIEELEGYDVYLKNVYSSEDLDCYVSGLYNRVDNVKALWYETTPNIEELEDDSFLVNDVMEVISFDSSPYRVEYMDIIDHSYTSADEDFYCVLNLKKEYPYINNLRIWKYHILNTPPEIVGIEPENNSIFYTSDNITIKVSAYDIDDDSLTFSYHIINEYGEEDIIEADNVTQQFEAGDYEWYVVIEDGHNIVRSESYYFRVLRRANIIDITLFEEGGSMDGVFDGLDNLTCRISIEPNAIFGLDYEAVRFEWYVNDILVQEENVYATSYGIYYMTNLSEENFVKHDSVMCRAYPIWHVIGGSFDFNESYMREVGVMIQNTPPRIKELTPENNSVVSVGDVLFEVDAEDADGDSLYYNFVIDDIDHYSFTPSFSVNLDEGLYEWYVEVSDGESIITSESRILIIAPEQSHVDDVIVEEENGVIDDYWETFDNILVKTWLSNYNDNTYSHIVIANDCEYFIDADNYSCSEILSDILVDCSSGYCEYSFDHSLTNKFDNLTVYVEGYTVGIVGNITSDNHFIEYIDINNIKPRIVINSPENNSIYSMFDSVVFSYDVLDEDDSLVDYSAYVCDIDDNCDEYSSESFSLDLGVGDYYWYVIADDGYDEVNSGSYYFSVIDPRPIVDGAIVIRPKDGSGYMEDRVETLDDLECVLDITSAEELSDILFRWYINDELVYEETVEYDSVVSEYISLLNHTNTSKHDSVVCEATMLNNYAPSMIYYGTTFEDSVLIENIPPEPPELIWPENNDYLTPQIIRFNVSYDEYDIDDDSITVECYISLDGGDFIQVDCDGYYSGPGNYEWYAITYDGEEYSEESMHFFFTVSSSYVIPYVEYVRIKPEYVYEDSEMFCEASVQGTGVLARLQWYKADPLTGEWIEQSYYNDFILDNDYLMHEIVSDSISGVMNVGERWRCALIVYDMVLDEAVTDIVSGEPRVVLVNPYNNSYIGNDNINFRWQSYAMDIDNYNLYLDNGEGFELIYSGDDNSFDYSLENGYYRWYVEAIGSSASGYIEVNSTIYEFYYSPLPCAVVDVSDVADNNSNIVCSVNPSLTSEEINGIEEFTGGDVRAIIRWYINDEYYFGYNKDCDDGCEVILGYGFTDVGDIVRCEAYYFLEYESSVVESECVGDDSVRVIDEIPFVELISPENNTQYIIGEDESEAIITFSWQGYDSDDDYLYYELHIDNSSSENVYFIDNELSYSLELGSGNYDWYIIVRDDEGNWYKSEVWNLKIVKEYRCGSSIIFLPTHPIVGMEDVSVFIETSDVARDVAGDRGIRALLWCNHDDSIFIEESVCTESCVITIPKERIGSTNRWYCEVFLFLNDYSEGYYPYLEGYEGCGNEFSFEPRESRATTTKDWRVSENIDPSKSTKKTFSIIKNGKKKLMIR